MCFASFGCVAFRLCLAVKVFSSSYGHRSSSLKASDGFGGLGVLKHIHIVFEHYVNLSMQF